MRSALIPRPLGLYSSIRGCIFEIAHRAIGASYMGQTARTMSGAETNKLIDAEIKRLVEDGLARAKEVLTEQEDKLHLLAQAMLEYETLTGDEIDQLMKNGKIDRPDEPKGPIVVKPTAGAAVPKAGKKFDGGPAPQGA